MAYQKSVIDLIKERHSCRSFSDRPIEPELSIQINQYLEALNAEAEKERLSARFILVSRLANTGAKHEKLGTYGMISGARDYLVGVIAKNEDRAWLFGSYFEKIILYATDLGLGTCWLGGSFSRADFARKAQLLGHEYVPIVSPVGYADKKMTAREKIIRMGARSNTRKSWHKLFFYGSEHLPMDRETAGPWEIPLEMVRLAPSASNKQPWRIIRDEYGFSFYLSRTHGYPMAAFDMQMNDLGIAMCHFELTVRELELPGEWQYLEDCVRKDKQYVMTWQF